MVSSKMSALITAAVVLTMVVTTKVAEGQGNNVPSCASKLVPCANYLNSTKPPSSCCDPLKEAVTKELPCLCNLYENPAILAAFNINLTQALKLPGSCGISGDLSACNASAPTGSATKPPPAVPGGGNNGNGVDKIVGTGLSSLLLLLASLMLC